MDPRQLGDAIDRHLEQGWYSDRNQPVQPPTTGAAAERRLRRRSPQSAYIRTCSMYWLAVPRVRACELHRCAGMRSCVRCGVSTYAAARGEQRSVGCVCACGVGIVRTCLLMYVRRRTEAVRAEQRAITPDSWAARKKRRRRANQAVRDVAPEKEDQQDEAEQEEAEQAEQEEEEEEEEESAYVRTVDVHTYVRTCTYVRK